MREIKFRAWDKTDSEMVGVDLIVFNDKTTTDKAHILDELNDVHYLNEIVLMQYTGLKDKNGVKIYEGDIVRKLSGDYKLGKVVFEFGMFCFESIGCGIYAGSDAFLYIHSLHYKEYNSNNNYEVIGNIYENPEILEK